MFSSKGMHISDKLHVSCKKNNIFLLGKNIIPSCALSFKVRIFEY